MSLHLYNTATRNVSEFKPLTPGKVGIYLCGATVQAPPHIGHIRSGVNFDILRRWLMASGFDVNFIRNVTDIDDKILQKAALEKMEWFALAMKYERAFSDAYKALNVLPPTYEPRATGHITQMVSLMQKLIDNGHAYAPGNGDVYLEVRSLKEYLTLSNQKLDDLQSAGDGGDSAKKDPRDFALWKSAKPGEPSWPSHGGGLDLIFPHHENEIAQSNAAGYGFAKVWMHNAWVTTSGEKMSKSLGNSLQVQELTKNVRGIELRWYLGSAHYRSMLEFSHEALEESATGFRRVEGFLIRAAEVLGATPEKKIDSEFTKAMNDDLAVPTGLAHISELVKNGNNAIAGGDKKALADSAACVRGALDMLGCDPFDPAFAGQSANNDGAMDGLVKLALEQREAARGRKDFAAADAIRDQIAALGIVIEDTATGPRWSIER